MESRFTYHQIREIVEGALKLPPDVRGAFLDKQPDIYDGLRQEVEEMLSFERFLPSFLETPLFPTSGTKSASQVGQRVGKYRLECELGRGGMGVVFAARRAEEGFEQLVAIKILDPRYLDQAGVARFRREGGLMARLDHPAIARIFDLGTMDDGQPYLVMELVDGEPIDEFCARARLPSSERIKLFLRVCDAVAEAHNHLVVHLDLKPANVLVDQNARPKLLDFGIARILPAADTSAAVTAPFASIRYSSPEQLQGQRTTVSADIYSLGVVLYELLTGQPAFEASDGLSSILQIRERPIDDRFVISARTPVAESGLFRVSGPNGNERGRLSPDLRAVLRKATAFEAQERYRSVMAFADDLEAILEARPVRARQATLAYRTSRFLRRNRAAVISSLVFAVLIVALILFLFFQSGELKLQRDVARQQRDRAEETALFLKNLFRDVDPSEARGRSLLAREVLDEGRARLLTSDRLDAETRADLLGTLGEVYRNLGLYEDSEPLLKGAVAESRRRVGDHHPDTIRWRRALAEYFRLTGQLNEASAELVQALTMAESGPEGQTDEIQTQLAGVRADQGRYREAEAIFEVVDEEGLGQTELVAHWLARARLYRDDGHLNLAREMLAKATETIVRLGPDHPMAISANTQVARLFLEVGDLEAAGTLVETVRSLAEELYGNPHREIAAADSLLAAVRLAKGEAEVAEKLLEGSQLVRVQLLGKDHPETLAGQRELARVAQERGDYQRTIEILDEAILRARSALGAEHPELWRLIEARADVELLAGRLAPAEQAYRETLEYRRRFLGENHRETAEGWANLARVLYDLGRLEISCEHYSRALEIYRNILGLEHPEVAETLDNYMQVLALLGRLEEAEKAGNQALLIRKTAFGERHRVTATSMTHLGLLLREQQRFDEAAVLLESALEIARETLGPDHPELATALNNAALVQHDQGSYEKSAPLFREAAKRMEETLGRDHPNRGYALLNLALDLNYLKRYQDALEEAKEAERVLSGALGEEHWVLSIAWMEQGSALAGLERYEAAEARLVEAKDRLKRQLGSESRYTQSALRRLARLAEAQGDSRGAERYRAQLIRP